MFDELIPRLKREMDPDDIEALRTRDEEPSGLVQCVMCMAGIPKRDMSSSVAVVYHHIIPRGMGGGNPNQLWNLAPTCNYHHQEPLHSYADLWRHAMVYTGKARAEDYGDLLEWPDEIVRLIPALGECHGMFPFGYTVYQPVPPILQRIFLGTEDQRITSFCLDICPIVNECIKETRARRWRAIRGSK